MNKMSKFFFMFGFVFLNQVSAYELINVPQLVLRIEDGNGFTVQQVMFNNQNITLEDAGGYGKPRQIATYAVRPDSYIIQWSVSKQKGRSEEVTSLEKLLYIDKGDYNVQIKIQGDRIQ